MNWCERSNVEYIIGYSKNNVVLGVTKKLREDVQKAFESSREKQRRFCDFMYSAQTWKRKRRIISKAEYNSLGDNNRFVVTNLSGDAQELYDTVYCARGDMENRIKEQQLDLFADRTSATEWWANQFRMLLSGLAYTLIDTLRRTALKNTALEKAQCGTIRLKLFFYGHSRVRGSEDFLQSRLKETKSYGHSSLHTGLRLQNMPGSILYLTLRIHQTKKPSMKEIF